MKKILLLLLISILYLSIIFITPNISSAPVQELAGLAVAETATKWNNVSDGARGDNLLSGVMAVAPYVWTGTDFDRVRGDTTYGLDVDVTRVSGNVNTVGTKTPSDGYANPTDAINSFSLLGLFNGTTWDRARGDTTNGLYVQVRPWNTPSDNFENPTNANNSLSFQVAFDGTNWDRVRHSWNNISCNAVGTTGPCTTIDISNYPMKNHTWTVVVTGSPASVQVDLQGSIDNVNWFTLDSSTTTTSEMRFVTGKGVMYYRGNVVTLSGGTSPTVTVRIASFKD
ncbi:MAG: hypothetical protein QXH95_03420 [Thermoplasmata archaeon]